MEDIEVTEPMKKKFKYCWGKSTGGYKTNISDLPYDVLIKIFEYLDFKSISCCAILCKTFNEISNDNILYRTVHLKYNMNTTMMTSYINKISYPKQIIIEYKFCDDDGAPENYSEFDEYVTWLIRKCSEYVSCIKLEGCRSDNILILLCECRNLTDIKCYRCMGNFDALPTLKTLKNITFVLSGVPHKVLIDTLQSNPNLEKLHLDSNCRLNSNDICQTLSRYNYSIQKIHLCEKKRVRAKGVKALARCSKLRILELTGGPFHCDPEDSLEQLAAGCPLLDRLTIYGWKEVNDENILPILHSCTQLRKLDLNGTSITVKSCREAALSLPLLKSIDIYKCSKIKQSEISDLQKYLGCLITSKMNPNLLRLILLYQVRKLKTK